MSFKGKKKNKMFNSAEGYDLYAPFYDEKKAFLDSFERENLWQMLSDVEGKAVLDIGCGTGRISQNLAKKGADVTGVDISEKMIRLAQKKVYGGKFLLADAEKLPFEDESFDCAVAAFLIVHLKSPVKLFEEVYRVLKPGGIFVLTNVNQRKAPKLKLSKKEEIVIESFYHRREEVIQNLRDSFFEIEKEELIFEENAIWINQIVKAKK